MVVCSIGFITKSYASLRIIDRRLYAAARDDDWYNKLSTLVKESNLVEIPEWTQNALFPACKRIRAVITCQMILHTLNDPDWHYFTHRVLREIEVNELENMFELIIFNERALLQLIYILTYYGECSLKKEWLETSMERFEFDIVNAYKIENLFEETPLHQAARRGNYDMVRWLVEWCSMSVKLTDKNGNTPLHLATFNGHVSVAQYLIGWQADINQENNDNKTPYNYACQNGSPSMQELMENARMSMIEALPVESFDEESTGGIDV